MAIALYLHFVFKDLTFRGESAQSDHLIPE